jgi:hypothetical protein
VDYTVSVNGQVPEPGPLDLPRYLVRTCEVRTSVRERGGEVEGRYEEKMEAPQ